MAKMKIATSCILLALFAATSTTLVSAFRFLPPRAPHTALLARSARRGVTSVAGVRPLKSATLPQQESSTKTRTSRAAPNQRPQQRRPRKTNTVDRIDIGVVSTEDDNCAQSWLRRLAYYFLQVPMYGVKFPFAIALGLWASRFWRVPTDADVVKFVEETGIILVLNRGVPPGAATPPPPSSPDTEQRHYYVDVKKCSLYHITREAGQPEFTTHIKSWSMTYTKTRPATGGDGAGGPWESKIDSFVVNGKPVLDPENQMSFLHLYATMGAHTKCHVYGNTLVQNIYKNGYLKETLMQSTWNTIWLHRGLLHGGLGPMTTVRTEGNKWAGLASPCTAPGLVAESHDMSSLGGCQHGLAQRWIDLDLPLSSFMLKARMSLRRVMIDHDIPMELLEAVFLSVVLHAIDHVSGSRCMWGLKFELDLWDRPRPSRRPLVCESAVWNFMWAAPTLNPLYDNRIKHVRKPFYRQLYQEMKKIDTLGVADDITASIMY